MSNYTVTLNYQCHYGYVEYNEATKEALVTLDEPTGKAAVERYLSEPLTLDVPQGETIRDFVTITLQPLADLASFKVALTRLWGKTGVRVEWSLPPGVADEIGREVLAEGHPAHMTRSND